MLTKGIVDEDFVNYKRPSMFINTCLCSFKCDKESGEKVCQNSPLVDAPIVEIDNETLIQRFLSNPITKAIVVGGLEPFDGLGDLLFFVEDLNKHGAHDDLVIYTGYTEDEISKAVAFLVDLCSPHRNLIIKFGRYKPNSSSVFDPILGVKLASDNQYSVLYPRKQTNL